MNEVIFTSSLLTLAMAMAAIVCLWALLRLLDRLCGFNFKRWMNELDETSENNLAAAIYLGLRFVGACLLIGLLFS